MRGADNNQYGDFASTGVKLVINDTGNYLVRGG